MFISNKANNFAVSNGFSGSHHAILKMLLRISAEAISRIHFCV